MKPAPLQIGRRRFDVRLRFDRRLHRRLFHGTIGALQADDRAFGRSTEFLGDYDYYVEKKEEVQTESNSSENGEPIESLAQQDFTAQKEAQRIDVK